MQVNQTRFWLGIALVIIGVPWIRTGMGAVPGSVLNGNRLFTGLGVAVIVIGLYLVISVLRGGRPPEQDEDQR